MAFDPDAYLKKKSLAVNPEPTGFDPDAYLQKKALAPATPPPAPVTPPQQSLPNQSSMPFFPTPETAPIKEPTQQPGIIERVTSAFMPNMNDANDYTATRAAKQALQGAQTDVGSLISRVTATKIQDGITQVNKLSALPDDYVEPGQPGVGSMGGYSLPTPPKTKAQLIAQAKVNAGVPPETSIEDMRKMAIASSEGADSLANESAQEELRQAAIDKSQGIGGLQSGARKTFAAAGQSALETMPLAIIPGVGLPAAFATGAALTGNRAITQGAEAGLSGKDIGKFAGTQAAIEGAVPVAFQAIGLPGLEKILKATPSLKIGLKEAAKRLSVGTIQELPEELVTTIGQLASEQQSGVTKDPDYWAGIVDTALQVAATGGLAAPITLGQGAAQDVSGATKRQENTVADLREMGYTDPEILRLQQGENVPTPQSWIDRGLQEDAQRTAAVAARATEPPSPVQAQADAILQASTAPPQENVPTATPEAVAAPLETQSSSPAPDVSPTSSTPNTTTAVPLPQEDGAGGDLVSIPADISKQLSENELLFVRNPKGNYQLQGKDAAKGSEILGIPQTGNILEIPNSDLDKTMHNLIKEGQTSKVYNPSGDKTTPVETPIQPAGQQPMPAEASPLPQESGGLPITPEEHVTAQLGKTPEQVIRRASTKASIPVEDAQQALNDTIAQGKATFDNKGKVQPRQPYGADLPGIEPPSPIDATLIPDPDEEWVSGMKIDLKKHAKRLGLDTLNGENRIDTLHYYQRGYKAGKTGKTALANAAKINEMRQRGDMSYQPSELEAAGIQLEAVKARERLDEAEAIYAETGQKPDNYDDVLQDYQELSLGQENMFSSAGRTLRFAQTEFPLMEDHIEGILIRARRRIGKLTSRQEEQFRNDKKEYEEAKMQELKAEQAQILEQAEAIIKAQKKRKGRMKNFTATDFNNALERAREVAKNCGGT